MNTMKRQSLGLLALLSLLLIGSVAHAEDVEGGFPGPRLSRAEEAKAWRLGYLADAHLTLGEYAEGIEAAKSAFRIARDVRMLPLIGSLYEEWGAHTPDPKEANRLYQRAVFYFQQADRYATGLPAGPPRQWARKMVVKHLPPLQEALEDAEEDGDEVAATGEPTTAELKAALAKAQDDLARERATREALEQALRALAAQKAVCPQTSKACGPSPGAAEPATQARAQPASQVLRASAK
jgi:tetratricopeptide (TPR) repeat protein